MAKILFIQNQWAEFPGVMYISGMLKAHGHTCDVVISNNAGYILREISRAKPDIAAFPTITGIHRWVLEVASLIKRNKIKTLVVLGGPHPTYFPEIIENENVDIICRGEGEYPMLALAGALSGDNTDIKNIPNLWVKSDGIIYKNEMMPLVQNLDELPFPDRELYSKYLIFRLETTKMFITSRGCPYNCAYCYNQKLRRIYQGKGRYLRRRSVRNVIDEIKDVKSRLNLKSVYFMDDTFIFDRAWVMGFLDVYRREIGLPFFCLGTADHLSDDEELIKTFKESGCYGIYFGIESGSEEIRKKILNKKISDEKIISTAALLKKYGLKFRAYNMAGIPTEKVEDVYKTIELNIKIRTDFPFCSIYTPYWGTTLCDYAIEKGVLEKAKGPDDFYTSYYGYSLLKQDGIEEMVNLQRFFQTAVLFPFLWPLIKKLAKLPPNIFFNIWFGMIFFWVFLRSEKRSFLWTVWFGIMNLHFLLEKKMRKK